MSIDPYTDVARWLDMDARAESMLRHPAGKRLESAEVRQARQDDEAIRLANSGRAQLRFPEWVYVLGLAVFGYGLLLGVLAAAALVEGWPW